MGRSLLDSFFWQWDPQDSLSCFPIPFYSFPFSPPLSPSPSLRIVSPSSPFLSFAPLPFISSSSPLTSLTPAKGTTDINHLPLASSPNPYSLSPTLRLTLICQLQMSLMASSSTATISAVVWHAVKAVCILCNNGVSSAHKARMRATLQRKNLASHSKRRGWSCVDVMAVLTDSGPGRHLLLSANSKEGTSTGDIVVCVLYLRLTLYSLIYFFTPGCRNASCNLFFFSPVTTPTPSVCTVFKK